MTGLTPAERWVYDSCFGQIFRLKHGWGYGRRSREENGVLAQAAALRAIEIVRSHPVESIRAIPAVLHRVVPQVTSERDERWWDEFAAMHPRWELRTWRDPLDPADFPVTASRQRTARNGAQLADLARTEILVRHGGIYVDADVQPMRPLDPLLEAGAFAAWEDDVAVPNAVMGCSPGHPAFAALLDLMLERTPGPTWWAGPGAATCILAGRDDVILYEPEAFYPVHYSDPEKDRKLEQFDISAHPTTMALHWYAGSWTRGRRG